ncbi:P27 family phage terminase small subunit [Roseinatronobacter monicus]|uniref:P27 family predicted phage terminase small subunit n=1 Tax=Roseinatronobacter monicus TaxID=393481 RepID=A0A543KHL7_9RHOB|nr:P27 family phage terminase small subunit [Roseinatronobacter monicus]TQM94554.1 P27 family predicted phage terminase small subunit [Roseinatronobacter monicus]
MGRPRKPTALKAIAGTKRPCRENPNEPQARAGTADPPAWLSDRAASHFARLGAILHGLGVASPDDGDMLALLSSRLEEIEILTATIEDGGRSYQTENGMRRAAPEVAMRNEAMRHAQSLLGEFGLSPATRAKVSARAPEAENPFAILDRMG